MYVFELIEEEGLINQMGMGYHLINYTIAN